MSGIWTAEAGHIFDGKEMCAHFLEVPGELDVILERILGAFGVENIAGVANGCFADGMSLLNRFHGDGQIRQIIQRVEYPENIDALRGRMLDEAFNNVIWII